MKQSCHPSVRFDGLELFLDSDRLGTFGLRDLWVSTRETTLDPWSAPVNLGVTVNSAFIDQTPFIASDRETLFFASNRPGGLGTSIFTCHIARRTRLSKTSFYILPRPKKFLHAEVSPENIST